MIAVDIQTEPALEVGDARVLWTHPYFAQQNFFKNYDIAPDGRFLMLAIPNVEESETMTIKVVLDWFSEIEDRLGRGE